MGKFETIVPEDLSEPTMIPNDAFVSPEYARAEGEKLWPKVWQMACRVEEIPKVGDYVTYDIMDDTIVVVRSSADEISAFFNVCAHRGRKLVEGCGHIARFHCKYHAWQYDLKGRNTRVLDKEDWNGALDQARLDLPKVQVDTWGGWVWVNMDPDGVPLLDYLSPIPEMLDPFEMEKMRYRWRLWTYFPSNWKVALEAFMEPYHVEGTHPQLTKFATFYAWSKSHGLHSNSGYVGPKAQGDNSLDAQFSNSLTRPGLGDDARISIAALQEEIWRTTDCTTTQTMVDAAQRLVDELPAGTPPGAVMAHWLASAKADDAAKGVIWPEIDPAHVAEAGSSWHAFPNMQITQGLTNALIYRARPHAGDPNQCIFEVSVLERYGEGDAPETEWVHADAYADRDKWPPVLLQDFDNMSEVQKGMRSRGFRSLIPNPQQERKIPNMHRGLAKYMDGVGDPKPLKN